MAILSALGVLLLTSGASSAPNNVLDRVYQLTMEGRRVGYSRYSAWRTPAGVRVEGDTSIRVSILGSPMNMRYRSKALYSLSDGSPQEYELQFTQAERHTKISVRFSGKQARVTTITAGQTSTRTLPWAGRRYVLEGNCMDTWVFMLRAFGSPMPREVSVLAPLAAAAATMKFQPVAVEKVRTPSGEVLCDRVRVRAERTEMEILVARKTRELISMRVPSEKAEFRLATASALQGVVSYEAGARLFSIVDEPLPEARILTYLKAEADIRIAGERVTVASLQSPVQKFTGTVAAGRIQGIFEVRPFQYGGEHAPSMSEMPPRDRALQPYLKAERNVESDAPEIRSLAQQLTRDAPDAWQAVQRIGEWMRKNIRYTITGSSALKCLRAKKGDCGPQSWLMIALCRAAGIPARITGGVLYSEALGGSFGQHYWVRVWMGKDGWVPIDPTTGEIGTLSPGHITLWDLGGLTSLKVKVLDYEPRRAPDAAPVEYAAYRPQVGQSERWVFVMSGKEMGGQTARCVQTGEEGGRFYSDWTYRFEIQLPAPQQKVTMVGGYSLWEDGRPRRLTFEADVGGQSQSGVYTFRTGGVEAELKVGDMPIKRSVALPDDALAQMNNVLSLFSAATRALRLKPGETRKAPFFAATGLQRLDMTFRCEENTRPLTVMGEERLCVVCEVEPIKNRFFMDAVTGELLRVEIEAAGLVIERR